MLQLKAPIETKVKADLCGSYESFTQRIRSNYEQINHYVGETDLLHLVTQPPEIFLMDGGDTMFASETNVENRQIQKVQVINNLVNRIMVSADASLSYQDRVYISNILHQLGIRDDRRFMSEVRKAFQETKNRNELINVYWNHMDELRNMVEEYQENNETEIREQSDILNEQVLHLHEEVNRRLQTGAIYRILQNFSTTSYNPRNITDAQYRFAEAGRLSREILLERLRETVRGEAQPLVYRHENYYEGSDTEVNEITVEDVSERVTSAVLLNLLDNIYQSSYEYIDHRIDNWYVTDSAYFQSAENTLERIENNTAYIQYLHDQSTVNEEEITRERNELSVLNQILDLRRWSDTRIQPSIGGNLYDNTSVTYREDSVTGGYREGDSFTETDLTHIDIAGDTEYNETDVINNEENIRQQLTQTYQENIVRNERYMQNLRQVMEQYRTPETARVTREEMHRSSLEALEHPEEFLQTIREEGEAERERREQLAEAAERALPEEQQIVHRLIRQYLGAPQEERERMGITMNNQAQLFYDIYRELPESERAGYLRQGQAVLQTSEGTEEGVLPGQTAGHADGEQTEQVRNFVREITQRETELRELSDREESRTDVVSYRNIREENREIIRQITERVVDRWRSERGGRVEEPVTAWERDTISFIHKNIETAISEDELNEIRQEIRSNREVTEKQINEVRTTNETTNYQTVNNVTNNVIEQNDERLQEIVNHTVRRQLDKITEKVYGRLERQLSDERRRRGL